MSLDDNIPIEKVLADEAKQAVGPPSGPTESVSGYLPSNRHGPRKLTEQQMKMLDLLPEANYDPIQAAKLAGYTHPLSAARALRKEINMIAEDLIANSSLKAAKTLNDIMDSEVPILGAKDKLSAAMGLLDRAGHVKKETIQHEHKVTGGVFILPDKEKAAVTIEEAEFTEVSNE